MLKKHLEKILFEKSFSSPYVVPFQRMSFPVDVRQMYPCFKGYILEIGSGWGEFAIELAKKQNDHFIFALEKKKKRILKAERRQREKNIPNIRWMILDINWFFDGLFVESSFDKIIINFPDPWPKKKHQKHRFMNKTILDSFNRITNYRSAIEFTSDAWSYVETSMMLLESSGIWSNQYGKGVVLKNEETEFSSFYEILQKKAGRNIYRLRFIKK